MRFRLGRALLVGSVVAASTFLMAATLSAQSTITGRVTGDGQPLGGATISISGTALRATTAENGTYSLTVPPGSARGQSMVIIARFIGMKPQPKTITVAAGSQTVDFALEKDPFRLEEVIVTGTAEATSLRKTTFAIGRVGEEQLQEVPGASALVAIQGKVAGVRLIPTSSQPGGEVALRLRGATSIGGRQDPLLIVDGVITQFGLGDVAPEDIERIEVIKGAAASSLYGSNAANGVVQVFTKRGQSLPDGGLKVSSRVEVGSNNIAKEMEFSRSHAWHVNGTGANACTAKNATWTAASNGYCLNASGSRIIEANQVADNPFSVYNNHWDEVVVGGAYATQYISVGQRRGPTNFNASVQNTRNEGVIYGLGGYTRQNYRLNVDQRLRSNVDASWSAFFGRSTNGRAAEGTGSPFYGLMFLQPDVDITAPNADGSPFNALVPLSGDVANDFNPLYELHNRKITQNRNRFSGSARVQWRMNNWLSSEGSFGYDQEGEGFTDLTPFGYLTSSGVKLQGSLEKRKEDNSQYNGSATMTAIRTFTIGGFGDVTNTTKIGATVEEVKNSSLRSEAQTLKVTRVPEFGAAEQSSLEAGSRDELIRAQNYLGVTTFDIKDRYIIDALIRRDASSLFGPDSREANYYRVSGAWRVSQDFEIPGIDEWRLRVSRGTAGLRPNFDDQYEILAVTPGGFSTDILGNPKLKPAKSTETEIGTNFEFGGGRFTFEYTNAKKETTDQILLVDLPSVAGFKQQWQNTGALESTTHEATLGISVINTARQSLTFNIVGDKTKQVITEWNLPERLYSFGQMPSAFFLGKGSNLGVLYGNKWVRTLDELYADPAKNALRNPGQTWSADSVMVNEDGYLVRKSDYGTINERAIKYTYCKIGTGASCTTSQITEIGDANPDFNMSFGGNYKYNRFVLNALMDWSQGGDLYNGTRQWAFQATRDKAQDQAGKAQNAANCGTIAGAVVNNCPQKALGYYGVGFYNGLDPSDYFVEDGSYMKLKELSLHYTLVSSQLAKIGLGRVPSVRLGLIGRNLLTFTDYGGMDPEVSGLFGDPFQVRMDWFQYPQFRTLSAVAEITF